MTINKRKKKKEKKQIVSYGIPYSMFGQLCNYRTSNLYMNTAVGNIAMSVNGIFWIVVSFLLSAHKESFSFLFAKEKKIDNHYYRVHSIWIWISMWCDVMWIWVSVWVPMVALTFFSCIRSFSRHAINERIIQFNIGIKYWYITRTRNRNRTHISEW